MSLTVEMLEKLKNELEQLPPVEDRKRVLNKKEAIQMLVDDVDNLRKKGYSYEQIAEILTSNHLAISAGTLKGYLSKARNVRPRGTKTRSTASKAKSISANAENPGAPGQQAEKSTPESSVRKAERISRPVNKIENGRDSSKDSEKSGGVSSGTFTPKPDSHEL